MLGRRHIRLVFEIFLFIIMSVASQKASAQSKV